MDFVKTAADISVILGCLLGISGIIYWAIRSKLKDEFCNQTDCEKKHMQLDASLLTYRQDISADIKEIKEIVIRLESRFYEWLSKK